MRIAHKKGTMLAPWSRSPGLLVAPGDAAAMAGAIDTMLGLDAADAHALGERARAHVLAEGYTTAAMCAATLDVYRELL